MQPAGLTLAMSAIQCTPLDRITGTNYLLYNHIKLSIHLKRTLFWVETCCENLNKEKSKALFVGVYFLQKTLNKLK